MFEMFGIIVINVVCFISLGICNYVMNVLATR